MTNKHLCVLILVQIYQFSHKKNPNKLFRFVDFKVFLYYFELISLLQSGDRWPQHFTHFPLDFKNNLCSILYGDVGKCMAGTVDIVRYIYIWQATPACPEKGTTLVETAPLDWFLKWLEAVTAASAKYALNAQSVRHALRLPGKKGEGQAKWAGLLCVNMLSNSRKDLGF